MLDKPAYKSRESDTVADMCGAHSGQLRLRLASFRLRTRIVSDFDSGPCRSETLDNRDAAGCFINAHSFAAETAQCVVESGRVSDCDHSFSLRLKILTHRIADLSRIHEQHGFRV